MTVMEHIIVGTEDWDDFTEDAEVVTTFESKDGPHYVVAAVYRGTPSGDQGCTLYVSSFVQDPEPSPTLRITPKLGDLMERLGAPADYADEVLDVRGTFLEGLKQGEFHEVQFAEEHPSIGSAVIRLAAIAHANATGVPLAPLDLSKGLVMLDALITKV